MYVRNYIDGLDIPWKTVFQTEEKSEVEKFCLQHAIKFKWLSDSHLRTSQILPATRTHPITSETVWFNQAHLFHISSLDKTVRETLLSHLGKDNLPRNTYYGDGTDIEDDVLKEIREAYKAEKKCSLGKKMILYLFTIFFMRMEEIPM